MNERINAFKKFLSNPERYYEDFVNIQYKPTKTWRQNWVEFVRDYADLAAYCGLLPAFFKNPFGDSEEDGYVFSDNAAQYLAGEVSPEEVLMRMKYANSSINLMRYPQYRIRVRPFYATLRLLEKLEELGVKLVDKKLLGAAVGCLRSEDEVEDAAQIIKREFTMNGIVAKFANKQVRKDFVREGERFSLSLVSFLQRWKLVSISKGRIKMVRITDKGREWIKKTPANSIFYSFDLGEIHLSPLVGYLLNLFEESVKQNIYEVDMKTLSDQLREVVDEDTLEHVIRMLKEIRPSPIKELYHKKLELNPLEDQYAVTPTTDFASLTEAAFIEKGMASILIRAPQVVVLRPPRNLLDSLRHSALSSEGSDYEDDLIDAFQELDYGKVIKLGHYVAGQRYSDLVWEVPIVDSMTNEEKTLLIIVEAKSGEAIRQFDERIVMNEIRNTIADKYGRKLPEIAGVWIWVLDGQSLPQIDGGHGGPRTGTKTFLEKMNDLLQLMTYVGRLVVVTAMNIESFLEYYQYLYAVLKQSKGPLNEVTAQNFWIWGRLFRPVVGYVFIHNDVNELRKKLFVPA